MTIRNMTIILNILKYDNLQYDNYFEKIVIFEFENMTKKQPMGRPHETNYCHLNTIPVPILLRHNFGL